MNAEGKQPTVVHFLANLGGGVWSVAKTLAACHRPRWRVMLVAMYKGPLSPAFAAEVDELFDAAYLVRRPPVKGIYYLAPVSVSAALESLGVDARAGDVAYHFHTGPYTPWVYRLPRRPRAGKWLATFHGGRGSFGDTHNVAKRWLYAAGVRRLLRERFTLVAVSHRSARDCADMYGCHPADFHVVYNGTGTPGSISRATPAGVDLPLRVGFVGTLLPQKGWHKVVAAVERLRREGLNVVCSIVGDGPELDNLKRLAAARADWLDAPGHVHKPEEHVLPLLDVLVLPSECEGHPRVVLEAMSRGVPCICSDVGGCAETVRDAEEGYILRENSAEEIAAYVKRMVNANGSRERMSRNCIVRHREMFTADKMAVSWERLYLAGRH